MVLNCFIAVFYKTNYMTKRYLLDKNILNIKYFNT